MKYKLSAIDTIISHMSENDYASHYVTKLAALAKEMRPAVSALGALHDTPNPTETSAAHVRRVANGANKLREKVSVYRDKANAVLNEGIRDIQSRIDAKVNLKADEKYAAEIRAVFRSKPYAEQLDLLGNLCKQNNGPELAAIVCAPAILSGIQEDMRAQFANHIVELHAPELVAERSALLDAITPVMSVLKVANEVATEYSDPVALAKIAAAEASANAAQAALNENVEA